MSPMDKRWVQEENRRRRKECGEEETRKGAERQGKGVRSREEDMDHRRNKRLPLLPSSFCCSRFYPVLSDQSRESWEITPPADCLLPLIAEYVRRLRHPFSRLL